MPSLRTRALTLALVAAGGGLVTGCGESDIQKKAREANDVVDTTVQAAEAAKQEALARESQKLDDEDRKDRKGLAKDLVDAVSGAADGAKAEAQKRGDQATDDAIAAAQKAVDDAQDEARKVQDRAQSTLDDAQEAIADGLATSP